jgi:hypothetical protein
MAPQGTSRVIIDPQTNAVVYQTLDASTGAIVEQALSALSPVYLALRTLVGVAGKSLPGQWTKPLAR